MLTAVGENNNICDDFNFFTPRHMSITTRYAKYISNRNNNRMQSAAKYIYTRK